MHAGTWSKSVACTTSTSTSAACSKTLSSTFTSSGLLLFLELLACRHLAQECGVHHIDLNFGCPVRKVTAKGGGSALPLRPKLFRRLVAAAVAAAGPEVPVTVKLRMGLDSELITFLQVRQLAVG
jgi:hypothetical protein